MRTHSIPFVIISAHLEHRTKKQNDRATLSLLVDLQECGYASKLVDGCYKGVREQSFVVPSTDVSGLLELARQYGQESILVVGSDRLVELDASIIGRWVNAPEAVALRADGWTREADGTYWIVEPHGNRQGWDVRWS